MISRVIEEQQAISAVLAENCKNWHKLLTDEEFRIIEALCTVLNFFPILQMVFLVRKVLQYEQFSQF